MYRSQIDVCHRDVWLGDDGKDRARSPILIVLRLVVNYYSRSRRMRYGRHSRYCVGRRWRGISRFGLGPSISDARDIHEEIIYNVYELGFLFKMN